MNMSRRTIIEMCATALARPSVLVGVLALGSDKAIGESLQEAPQRVFSESGHSAAERAVLSAKGVLERLLGERAGEFELHWIASQNEHPVYEYSCANGVPVIRGTSGVAIARGAYMYLREYCNVMVTWGGKHLQLPAKFPDAPSTRTESPYKFVEYLNPCTFGYSTPFWKWERWEKELDWMALHGISMPLAMEGQEAVWQKVWTSFGVTQEEQDRFSVGPAYLPWHWMGNINYFEGPLPQEWIEQKANLQSNILRRMRELGMSPIAPAFAGYVPEAFLRLYPKADISALLWHKNMPQQAKTFLLHPSETKLFQEIGRRFIVEYRQMYGEVSYYLADAFNEMQPPVSKDNRYEDLRLFGKTVYDSIKAGDANATWVMQGWLFTTGGFWDTKSTEAFLSAIPNDKMIILDYANDRYIDISRDAWKRLDSFYGKPWMNGMLHTFGGNNNVKGNLPLIVQQSAQTLADSGRKNLVGWAIVMEGIETNEVCYELMADVGWSSQQIDLHNWIAKYCLARYGDYPPAIKQAWLYLLKSAYSMRFRGVQVLLLNLPILIPAKSFRKLLSCILTVLILLMTIFSSETTLSS
jgi:alpha-N-acetylglucosaminidase